MQCCLPRVDSVSINMLFMYRLRWCVRLGGWICEDGADSSERLHHALRFDKRVIELQLHMLGLGKLMPLRPDLAIGENSNRRIHSSRAWRLQEQPFTSRSACFASKGVVWECCVETPGRRSAKTLQVLDSLQVADLAKKSSCTSTTCKAHGILLTFPTKKF